MAWIWMAFKYQTLKRCWYSNSIWIPDLLLNLINGHFCHLNSGQIVSENVNAQISVVQYSNHLNTGLVWYSNGRFVSGCQKVLYLNGGLKTGLIKAWLWSKMSGMQVSGDGYCIATQCFLTCFTQGSKLILEPRRAVVPNHYSGDY